MQLAASKGVKGKHSLVGKATHEQIYKQFYIDHSVNSV